MIELRKGIKENQDETPPGNKLNEAGDFDSSVYMLMTMTTFNV